VSGPPFAAGGPPRLRLSILLTVVGCLFVALVARLWFLQVVDTASGTAQVSADTTVTLYIPAPRGELLDRSGQVLVGTRQIPVIEVDKADSADGPVVARLADLLGVDAATMRAAIGNDAYAGYAPVPVLPPATPAELLYVAEHPSLFPGVTATTESQPEATALGAYAGDVVGYVGQIDAPTLAEFQRRYPSEHYQAGDLIGLTGAEAEFQQVLAGTPGVEKLAVNAENRAVRVESYVPPVPGDNVVLALDGHLQEVADRSILQGQAVARSEPADTGGGNYKATGGSAVVEDPRNGQILALATEPTFDPNWFDQGITESEYLSLADNPADPLEDRALQAQYAPGSTFKLATATAGLHDGIVTPGSVYDDTGQITVDGHVFHDDGGVGAGPIVLADALTVSSDNYFNVIGEDLWDERATFGPLALQDAAASYGFGSPTGVDLPGEAAGLLPTPAQQVALKKAEPDNPDALGYWVVGDSIESAIGQFQVEVTPIQLANAYATFANGGTRYRPQIALRITSPSGRVLRRFAPVVEGHAESLTASERAAMVEGYLGVTHDLGRFGGTGAPVFAASSLAGEDIAGKTGTAQVTCTGCQDTSVFTAFAPASDPAWEVDCFMEDAGYGESIAAPVVRRIYDAVFHKRLDPVAYQPVTGSPG